MFHRRLRIFLWVLALVTAGLLFRALQLQVLGSEKYQVDAGEAMKRIRLTETVRGSILDRNGVVLAADEACMDVCVDYRAITSEPDEKWMRLVAAERLRRTGGREYDDLPRSRRRKMIDEQVPAVRVDIGRMWQLLAAVSEQSSTQIDGIRQSIVQKVELRRRQVWMRQMQRATERRRDEPESWLRQWLLADAPGGESERDFDLVVSEQTEAHPILRNVDPATYNMLGKQLDQLPGLVLRSGTTRRYPLGDIACHIIGRQAKVTREDLKEDPGFGDDLRRYQYNDLVGRSGIEAMAEQQLRGTRGRIESIVGKEGPVSSLPSRRGEDVRLSIDAKLQEELTTLYREAKTQYADGKIEKHVMHGAAVVIDVPTGEVRALVSYPTYDLNRFDELYAKLVIDDINTPLLNRATQAQLEPGSVIKPVVALAALASGVMRLDEGLQCHGFLVINGVKYAEGRCWVQSKFARQLGGRCENHPVPWDDPLPPPYLLRVPDALQRSCNTFFETLADRLKLDGLSRWFKVFGLGQRTGIGIEESAGRLPDSYAGANRRMTTWFAGIGQGSITATPIQMANIAATIARDGVWTAPTLLAGQRPERRDLGLPRDAVAAVKEGMVRVVNTHAGTGNELQRKDYVIAGKTGTAQAARRSVPIRDEDGKIVLDANGRVARRFLVPSTRERPNPEAPWYRGTGPEEADLAHAWFIGFAPAHKPQIAFAVMVEYGGSGGITAADIAKDVIEACIQHGYLTKNP